LINSNHRYKSEGKVIHEKPHSVVAVSSSDEAEEEEEDIRSEKEIVKRSEISSEESSYTYRTDLRLQRRGKVIYMLMDSHYYFVNDKYPWTPHF